jgi:hypothetical protein
MRVTAFVMLFAFLIGAGARADDRIDRVLAVVNGNVITESDVRAARAFGLVRPPRAGTDPIRTALDQLIRRELILREVARSTPAESAPERVDAALSAIRARFASRAEYEARLAETAMNETRLRDMVEADMLVEDYLKQRFGAVAEPSDTDIASYYETSRADFTSGGRQLTLDEARPAVRERLLEERRRQLVDDWVARLRRRAEVTDVYLAATAR